MDMHQLGVKLTEMILDTAHKESNRIVLCLVMITIHTYSTQIETYGLLNACDAVRNIGANALAQSARVH